MQIEKVTFDKRDEPIAAICLSTNIIYFKGKTGKVYYLDGDGFLRPCPIGEAATLKALIEANPSIEPIYKGDGVRLGF